jgi:hypothetical protein
MTAVRSEGELFVVYGEDDEGHNYLVSLDEPAAAGATYTTYGDKLHLLVIPRRWRAKREPHSRGRVRAAIALAVPVSLCTALVAAIATSWWAAGLGLIGTWMLILLGNRLHKASVRRHWPRRHRVLRESSEVNLFARAFRASRKTLTLWPAISGLMPDDAPRRQIVESLWTLALMLDHRAALRTELPHVDEAGRELPAEAVAEMAGLMERHHRMVAALERQREDVERLIGWLETLAGECQDFVRFEHAVRGAREAMRRADELLDPDAPTLTGTSDPIQDLVERIHFTVAAYRFMPGPEVLAPGAFEPGTSAVPQVGDRRYS